MKKKVAITFCTILIIILITLTLPWGMGLFTEYKFKELINVINSDPSFKVENTTYQRGWFTTTVTTKLSLQQKTDPQTPQQFNFNTTIFHGPVVIRKGLLQPLVALLHTQLNLDIAQNAILNRAPDAGPIGTITTAFKFEGSTRINIGSPPLTWEIPNHNLKWLGARIIIEFSPTFDQIHALFNFSGLEINTPTYSFQTTGLTGEYNSNEDNSAIWPGNRKLKIKNFSIKQTNTPPIEFYGLDLDSLTVTNQKSISIKLNAKLDTLNILNNTFTNNTLLLEFNEFDKASLLALQQYLNELKNNQTPEDLTTNKIAAILNEGGRININQFNITSLWGKMLATAKIIFADNQPKNQDLSTIFSNCTITTDIQLEPGLATYLLKQFYESTMKQNQTIGDQENGQEAPSLEQIMPQLPPTTDKNPFIRLSLDYKNNQLLLNGSPFNILGTEQND